MPEQVSDCSHVFLALGSHPDFRKGYLCLCCKKFINQDAVMEWEHYGAVIVLFRRMPK